ncbi:DUF4184 family protein [Kitasatospora sp. NPDC094015]|uniref:DUF4184 family protein n=1 Tax=Kitasatospora sp. NPDC094015 TaxID=3155205 RepID=UPI00332D8041
MPFTFSHPAAVLALLDGARARGPLVAAGLVAGSMAPDLPFFADSLLPGVHRYGDVAHRWWAVPTLDVALAAVSVALWRGLWRPAVAELLPGRAGWVSGSAAGRPAGGPVRFAVSAAVGAASHLCWDSFTHRGRAGVRALPVLGRTVAGVPVYRALQYGSSLAGLAVLAPRLRVVAAPAAGARPGPGAARWVVAAAAAAGAAHRLARRQRPPVDEFCFGAGAGAAVGLAGWSLLLRRAGVRGA